MEISKKYRVVLIIIFALILLGLTVSIPSLARLKNRNTIYNIPNWDGTVATSYSKGDGSKENPYIISNASEFAFFMQQLNTTDYEGINFELSNDIVINIGFFDYDETEGLKYVLDDKTYYVKEFTNEYYENVNYEGIKAGTVNLISPSTTFKGVLNGNSFTVFGTYITDSNKDSLAFFETLEGEINDLYISNSIIYGKSNVSGISNNLINSTLTNIVYDGYVVNKADVKTKITDINSLSMISNDLESNNVISIPNVLIDGSIKSVKLSGEYSLSNMDSITSIKINGTDITSNVFEVDLGNTLTNELTISSTSVIDSTEINFTNLKYIVEYYDDVTSGIATHSSNNSLNNVINKAEIYGNYMSAGFIGTSTGSLEMNRAYNTGKIVSNYISSGIIGRIKDNSNNTEITNVYNKGLITSSNSAGILGESINNIGTIDISNAVNISDVYSINRITSSTINITNSYSFNGLSVYSGTVNGLFEQIEPETLHLKDFMKNMSYDEFVSLEDIKSNLDNAWIYGIDDLPILYIDDLNNPIANISLNKYSWDNLGSELNILKFSNNITFKINSISNINQIKEKYYYITNSMTPLTADELNNITTWNLYENEVTIDQSGYYSIYAKIIDMNDQVTYINTDVLALNESGVRASISLNEKTWTSYRTKLDKIYINEASNIEILASLDTLDISNIQYYISTKELTKNELSDLVEWNDYIDGVSINSLGKYIVYAKITDSESTVSYINTDYIIYNGYKETLSLGNNNINYNSNTITNKSSIKLMFDSDFEFDYKEGYKHSLISNILLPLGTQLTLIDKNSNKIYKKTIDIEEDLYGYADSGNVNATYSFDLFKQLGIKETKYYDESLNYNKTISKENFVIIIDFNKANISNNYNNVKFSLAIESDDNQYLYKTLKNEVNDINICSSVNGLNINTAHTLYDDYSNQIIYYNKDSQTDINFANSIEYQQVNNKNIIDTLYESKKVGLLIRLYNKNNEQINKQYLDNMIFEVGNKEYFADSDNAIRINLNSSIDTEIKTLKIKTKENSSYLSAGSYYLKINKFISNDGYYYDNLYADEIIIPVEVSNERALIPDYIFDIKMNDNNIILDKSLESSPVQFEITLLGELKEPNLKVSLYEKSNLTAYDQNYSIVDLANYTSDELVHTSDKKYPVSISNNKFGLNLLPSKFNNNGYKYIFELYDGVRKISKLEKYFIVR